MLAVDGDGDPDDDIASPMLHAVLEAVYAIGQLGEGGPGTPFPVVEQGAATSRKRGIPSLSTSSVRRRTATALAPICPSRSPRRSQGVREAARNGSRNSSAHTPSLTATIGETT